MLHLLYVDVISFSVTRKCEESEKLKLIFYYFNNNSALKSRQINNNYEKITRVTKIQTDKETNVFGKIKNFKSIIWSKKLELSNECFTILSFLN